MTRPLHDSRLFITLATAAAVITACGGGSPLDNAATLNNPAGTSGQKLSFVYFQRCVNPVLNTPLQVNINGAISTSTCAAGGCHDNTNGTGGALRLLGAAAPADPALGAAAVRATDMYKNYYSSLGESVVGAPEQSRLLNKPLIRSVLHGGGLIFASPEDLPAKTLRYWINHPMPQGRDEFAPADAMFTPADPVAGACNVD
jgi:hypothetical protein